MLKSLEILAQYFADRAADTFLAWGSMFSLASLVSALAIAVASLAWRRAGSGRTIRPRALIRALFPMRVLRSASSRADLGLFLFNTLPAGALLAWIIVSASQVGAIVQSGLATAFGAHPAAALSPALARGLASGLLFLAYEFAYWLDHYLSHRVPILWEFHKVHHTAEVLTPVTAFRVHPVDTLVFANITALVTGAVGGLISYALGPAAAPFSVSGANVILVAFAFLTIHLQHSHVWISFTGVAGRILLSPAHHQLHHSSDPAHFNRNFGSCLSVFDWAFGTLLLPKARREPLRFGVAALEGATSPHSVTATLVTPFAEAFRCTWIMRRGARVRDGGLSHRGGDDLSPAGAQRPAGRPAANATG